MCEFCSPIPPHPRDDWPSRGELAAEAEEDRRCETEPPRPFREDGWDLRTDLYPPAPRGRW